MSIDIRKYLVPKHTKEKPLTFSVGIILWFLLVFSYLLFVVDWGLAFGLNGKTGAEGYGTLGYYFPTSTVSEITSQGTNFGITIGRAIGSIAVGWAIAKLTHKYAVILALGLMLFGIIAPYSPTYAGFVIMRLLLAIGGTTMIVLVQPIVSAYFNNGQKAVISQFTPWFYPIGTIITLAPFAFDSSVSKAVSAYWQEIYLGFGLATLIPLVGYILLGSRFDIYPSTIRKEKEAQLANPNQEKLSIWRFIKQKDTWIWTLLYGSWLIAVVFPSAFSKTLFAGMSNNIYSLDTKISTQFNPIISVFLIIFLCGIFAGPFTVGLWSKYKLKRRYFIGLVLGLGVLFYVLATIVFLYMVVPANLNSSKTDLAINGLGNGTWLFYILGFLMGVMLWGIQGVILNLPHEYKGSNPKKVGYQFGLIWGLGYAFYSIATVLVAVIKSASTEAAYAVFIILAALSVVGILLSKEPNSSYKLWPSKGIEKVNK